MAEKKIEEFEVYRGVLNEVNTRSPVESWSLAESTAKKFGKILLKDTVPVRNVLFTYKSVSPDIWHEKDLKGKKEIAVLGLQDGDFETYGYNYAYKAQDTTFVQLIAGDTFKLFNLVVNKQAAPLDVQEEKLPAEFELDETQEYPKQNKSKITGQAYRIIHKQEVKQWEESAEVKNQNDE